MNGTTMLPIAPEMGKAQAGTESYRLDSDPLRDRVDAAIGGLAAVVTAEAFGKLKRKVTPLLDTLGTADRTDLKDMLAKTIEATRERVGM